MAFKSVEGYFHKEHATILAGGFRNFSGSADQWNEHPAPNFCVQIDESDKPFLAALGIRVNSWTDVNAEEPVTIEFIRVRVGNYAHIEVRKDGGEPETYPPELYGDLDFMDIESAYVSIQAYPWEKNGRSGVTAYLSMLLADVNSSEMEKAREAWANG